MNIAVLGSNCKFSSDLAIQLNNLKKSSLVYRYDLLADFKKSVPLYKSLVNNSNSKKVPREVDIDFEGDFVVNPTKETKVSPMGEYVGDVEKSFIEILNEEERIKNFKLLESTFNLLNMEVDNSTTYDVQCTKSKVREAVKNGESFSPNLLNIINIYSGVLNQKMLDVILETNPLTVIIKVNNEGFLPLAVTDKYLDDLVEKNPQTIVLKVSSIKELLLNNFFISTFNLNEKKKERKKKEEDKEEQKAVTLTENDLNVFLNEMAHQPAVGVVHHMGHMVANAA